MSRAQLQGLRVPAALFLALFLVSFQLFTLRMLIAPVVHGLGTTVGPYQAVLVLFSIVAACFVPTSGRLGAMHGEWWLFRLGLWLFILSSLAAAASPNIGGLFIGFSLLGGLAAAPLVTLPWGLMQRQEPGRQRDIGLAALGLAIALGSAVAPPLAGFIADAANWRFAFLPQTAIAAGMLLLIRPLADTRSTARAPIDWLATGLALTGLTLLLCGLSLVAEYGWWEPRKLYDLLGIWQQPFALSIAPILIMAGLVVLSLLALERRIASVRARGPALHLGPMRDRRFMAGTLTAALHGVAIAGLFFALFIYIPFAFELNSLATSIAVLPFSLANLVVLVASGPFARRLNPRSMVQCGLLVCAAGSWLLLNSISEAARLVEVMPGLIVMGAGSGLVYGQIASLTLSRTPAEAAGESSGIYNSLQDLGGSLGTAVLGAVLILSISATIVNNVGQTIGLDVGPEQRKELVYEISETVHTMTPGSTPAVVAQLDPERQQALRSIAPWAAAEAMRTTLLAICAVLGLATITAFYLPRASDTVPG